MKIRKIKKWVKMIFGKGTLHVRKGEGLNWSIDEVKGFFIDYSGKLNAKHFDENGLPLTMLETGDKVLLPITIIQYGLGCYEKMLQGEMDKRMPFYKCADFLLNTQDKDGSWKAFEAQKKQNVMSSMVQGEAASLLIRAFIDSKNNAYLEAATRACDFMLLDKRYGGTSDFVDGHKILLEGTESPMILNGSIYSMFGLYDLWLTTREDRLKIELDNVLSGIEYMLPKFNTGYWSYYCLNGAIASPFYHDLHIVQLKQLYKLTKKEIYIETAQLYEKYYRSKKCYSRAFIKKAFQKLRENDDMIAIVE